MNFAFSNASSSSFSFLDRDDAMIILELERTLSDSPRFNLQRFREILEAKDRYGNGQVSRQQGRRGAIQWGIGEFERQFKDMIYRAGLK